MAKKVLNFYSVHPIFQEIIRKNICKNVTALLLLLVMYKCHLLTEEKVRWRETRSIFPSKVTNCGPSSTIWTLKNQQQSNVAEKKAYKRTFTVNYHSITNSRTNWKCACYGRPQRHTYLGHQASYWQYWRLFNNATNFSEHFLKNQPLLVMFANSNSFFKRRSVWKGEKKFDLWT